MPRTAPLTHDVNPIMQISSDEKLRLIAAQLRSLLDTSPQAEGAVEAWTENAHTVYDHLRRDFPNIRLPIQVTHFVHDADVRARDALYRHRQEETNE